jgi:uncharacterized membrane protein YhdT
MASRLGDVLFWLGIIIAVGWLVLSYFALSTRSSGGFGTVEALTVFTIPAISLALGWALRYILRG